MTKHRIFFKDNPWPEGHPIEEFVWSAVEKDGDIWFHFHLETKSYYAERDIEHDDDKEYERDWDAPIVWGNFHRCTLSTNNWHDGGFKVCSIDQFSESYLDGLELEVDMHPEDYDDWDEHAFHIYLLGHDACAKHKIKFTRTGESLFDIAWTGKIALAYVGDYEFTYDFEAVIQGAKLSN